MTEDMNGEGPQTDPSSEKALKDEIEGLKETIRNLKEEKESVVSKLQSEKRQLTREKSQLITENASLRRQFEILGQNSVKGAKLTNKSVLSNGPAPLRFSQLSTVSQPSTFGQGTGAEGGAVKSDNKTQDRNIEQRCENSSPEVSVQESMEGASMPTIPVETSRSINYRRLLAKIAKHFQPSNENIVELFLYLDDIKVIGDSDMRKLREFFEKMLKFDIVHLIDCFASGDYALLREPAIRVRSPEPVGDYQESAGLHPGTRAGTSHASHSSDMRNTVLMQINGECCICHEDVSTGCGIFSHKVHKECAIRSGNICCPICGESYFPVQEEYLGGPLSFRRS